MGWSLKGHTYKSSFILSPLLYCNPGIVCRWFPLKYLYITNEDAISDLYIIWSRCEHCKWSIAFWSSRSAMGWTGMKARRSNEALRKQPWKLISHHLITTTVMSKRTQCIGGVNVKEFRKRKRVLLTHMFARKVLNEFMIPFSDQLPVLQHSPVHLYFFANFVANLDHQRDRFLCPCLIALYFWVQVLFYLLSSCRCSA